MATFAKSLPPSMLSKSVKKLRATQSVDHEPRLALLSTILFLGNVGTASDRSSELVHWPRLAAPRRVLDVVAMGKATLRDLGLAGKAVTIHV
jgi:hypothetical protein